MRQKVLLVELGLLLSLIFDYFIHYLPIKAANIIFYIALFLAFYLFKPYFIWADLVKRHRERKDEINRGH